MGSQQVNRFVVNECVPSFSLPGVRASMSGRVETAREMLRACHACPRNCRVDRASGEAAFCGVGRHAHVTAALPHFGEEDCLRGTRGSGTVFFAKCNLRCVFCQNWDISQSGSGQETEPAEIARTMLQLQEQGCHNVNLVSPAHVVPQIVEAIALAVEDGLTIPIVYNSGGYDSVASLRLLDGLIDIYMPDFKFIRAESAKRFCQAEDYPQHAQAAIREMHRQVGPLCVDADGIAVRGLLVRHLVMPGLVNESREILRWLASEVSPDTYVNVMGQYHPDYQVGGIAAALCSDVKDKYHEINRRPTRAELEQAYAAAREAGLWRFDERRPSS